MGPPTHTHTVFKADMHLCVKMGGGKYFPHFAEYLLILLPIVSTLKSLREKEVCVL